MPKSPQPRSFKRKTQRDIVEGQLYTMMKAMDISSRVVHVEENQFNDCENECEKKNAKRKKRELATYTSLPSSPNPYRTYPKSDQARTIQKKKKKKNRSI